MTSSTQMSSPTMILGRLIFFFCCSVLALAPSAHAQRAGENAVSQASDAFGTTVGREEIGLYSATSARGFSPSQAGNLRIDGMYFDQVAQQARPVSRIVRGSSVHVGISAQGFPFPAPTGVVDFHLRTPDERSAGGGLLGIASRDRSYAEVDYHAPLISEALSVGGGVAYARNPSEYSRESAEWSVGGIAAWQPSAALKITPFWSRMKHLEDGELPFLFIGNSGYPRYHGEDRVAQSWGRWGYTAGNYGATAQLTLANNWRIDTGIFRSEVSTHFNYEPFLVNTDSQGEGDYSISGAPPRTSRSTSGEMRVSKQLASTDVRNTFYLSLKGRDRSSEAGGAQTIAFGRGSISAVPIVERPDFRLGRTSLVRAEQLTPGIGYDGVWRNVGQLSLGVQKSFYDRTISAPDAPSVSSSNSPWLYNIGGAAYLSSKLVAYASFTRGFEEIGTAPVNAANRDEAVPAQLTEQVDAGLKYQIHPKLTFVAGVFEIEKPYFDLDDANIFRHVGTTSNRGVEISLAGAVTDRFTVVAGGILIDPTVTNDSGAGGGTREAIGPLPSLVRMNLQYRVPFFSGLNLDAKIENTSRRWARYPSVRLPAVTTVDLGGRYTMQLFDRDATFRMQVLNATNEYRLEPSASGRLNALESRRYDLSLAFDF